MDQVSVKDVAKTLLSYESMTHKKLQKLCYYVQGWHMALLGEPLFEEDIEAWVHGPVCPPLYHDYIEYGWDEIPSEKEMSNHIKGDSLEVIKEVLRVYNEFSGDELEALSHQEKPWKEAREGLDPLEPSNNTIDLGIMREYFLELYQEGQND